MSWLVIFPAGVIIGILLSSAYPEVATEINGAVSPVIEDVGEALSDKLKDGILSIIGN